MPSTMARAVGARVTEARGVLQRVAMRAHSPSSSGFSSDTNLLVEACIAKVREAARLDDDAVLPPLPRVAPRRGVVIFAKHQMADSAAARAGASPRSLTSTQCVPQRSGRARSRWAVAFCAMVASAFGAAAFLVSPLGHTPPVLRATTAACAHASAAAHATAAFFTR